MNAPNIDPASLPLRDIHLPAVVSWWPPALGWWLVALSALTVLGLAWWWSERYRARRANRAALKLLEKAAMLARAEPVAAMQTTSVALRRFLITSREDSSSASVTGAAWLELLDSCWDQGGFSQGEGRLLAHGPYMPADRVETTDAESLIAMARQWLSVQAPAAQHPGRRANPPAGLPESDGVGA